MNLWHVSNTKIIDLMQVMLAPDVNIVQLVRNHASAAPACSVTRRGTNACATPASLTTAVTSTIRFATFAVASKSDLDENRAERL